jgi:hypothetical protein
MVHLARRVLRLVLEVSFLLLVVDTSLIVVSAAGLVECARLIRLKMGGRLAVVFDVLGLLALTIEALGEASWILLEHELLMMGGRVRTASWMARLLICRSRPTAVTVEGRRIAVAGATMMEFLPLRAVMRTLGIPMRGIPVVRLHGGMRIC